MTNVLSMKSRNDLRNPARAAGELEGDDLVRIEVDGVDQYARLLGVLRFIQLLEREGAGFGRPTEHLEVTLGMRYSIERKNIDYSMLDSIGILLANYPGYTDRRTFNNFSPKIGLS